MSMRPAYLNNIGKSTRLLSTALSSYTAKIPCSEQRFNQSFIRGSVRNASTGNDPKDSTIVINNQAYPKDSWTNIPPGIASLVGKNLHLKDTHPVGIVRSMIEERLSGLGYTTYNEFTPIVSTYENFDTLGFPKDHPGRSKTDTYYVNETTLLRTHTSAHELECFQSCKTPGYLISADVYRRDTIDKTHYSVFHQMEGARSWERTPDVLETLKKDIASIPDSGMQVDDPNPSFDPDTNPKQSSMSDEETDLVSQHLKKTIELVVGDIFSRAKQSAIAAGHTDADLFEPVKARWNYDLFPWTAPSYEIEVWWKGEWLEICGCGVVKKDVFDKAGVTNKIGWAFGIGLDRTAMVLFRIPDIRLLWSDNSKFLDQFIAGQVSTFRPYSKFPTTYRDIAFWCPPGEVNTVHINEFAEVVRNIGGDLVESIDLIDHFVHPKTNRLSQCYRIVYQSMDRTLTNDEVNDLQEKVRETVAETFKVEMR